MTATLLPARRRPSRRPDSGMVLVMALAALAVMLILLLALFKGAAHQMRGAQQTAAIAREKILADSAVALVIGQIQQASTMTNLAWTSQPGLLRTYAAARVPTACYKLYSTTNLASMTDTNGTVAFLSNDIPANWTSSPSQYTDINAPAQVPGGSSIYPILDPGAVVNSTNLAAGTAVEGITTDSGAVTMPVAWLHELQDGTIGPASNATSANPIVARFAFWTDDDCCKININTAGVGAAWNTPRLNSTNDWNWSTNQPATGEYSAYPAHPAMTSLAAVFGTNAYTPQQLLGLTPRYAWGGSQLGTQPTTPGAALSPRADRLYASVDELAFSTSQSASSQRVANPVTTAQLEMARFALTAHSQAPETTILGEPRFAIWPVADSTSASSPRMTATDRAITNVATVGLGTSNAREYFFQRNNPLSTNDDFDPTSTAAPSISNVHLFSDLIARGSENPPGCGTTFSTKYPGANWTQVMLEIVDYVRALNAVDPSPAPFVSFTTNNPATHTGLGFVEPLTTSYVSGSTKTILRGLGRCPTLSSLTIVFYVCGFKLKNGTVIDYDANPDTLSGTSWNANFLPGSVQWPNVTGELIRAFVIPCTFVPACGYPEMADACKIQITGLNNITVTSHGISGSLGFPASATSRLLSDAQAVLPVDRAWGGNEGPLAWRASAIDAMAAGSGSWMGYPFLGTNYYSVPMTTTTASSLDPKTGGTTWPPAYPVTFTGVTGLTVNILDANGVVLQTSSVNLPAFTSSRGPTINGECDHMDGSTPATANPAWATSSTNAVFPSYYMNLKDRVLATQNSRSALIQAGDLSRSVEANTDLRLLSALSTVAAGFFSMIPTEYASAPVNAMGGSHAHNLHFADGTGVCFGPYNPPPDNSAYDVTQLVSASYAKTNAPLLTAIDWNSKASVPYYRFTTPACNVPTGTKFVTMMPTVNASGDWDTGPGFAPDGAQINLPDSGTTNAPASAYFSLSGGNVGAPTLRTPNELVPSPVVFGSLPAGINPLAPTTSTPWRTLLFCPYPAANNSATPYAVHPGAASPPDHLILDNFWMPVIEPYAISTRLATAGKINLNDQIAPFTYLHRNTALHALLTDLLIPAIPASFAGQYKSPNPTQPLPSIWNAVDENATISQIENKFTGGSADAYLSESEICTVPIVPLGQASTQASLDAFWSTGGGQLTGDNLRELPYAQLYPRLTVRSNSYTVHVRVQILKKLPNDPNQNVWNEGVDLVMGDWRGSYEIERYLDPNAAAPNFTGQQLGPYKFRIVSSRRFAP